MTDEKRIFSLRYVGERFRNHRMPVEVLTDLPAFRDLLLSFAKDEWRSRHPDRKKLPRNFDKELTLSLFAIEDGSAQPQLEWTRQVEQELLFGLVDETEEIVEAGYNQFVHLIKNADDKVTELSSDKVRFLNRFGAGLQDGEKIELPVRGSAEVVILDVYRRKRLIMAARETYQTRYQGAGHLIGTLSPTEAGGQCFILVETEIHSEIRIPVDRLQLYEEFMAALNTDVQFDLMVELDRQDKLRSVVDVFDVEVVGDPDELVEQITARLAELRGLQDGWRDGAGSKIAAIALTNAESFINATPGTRSLFRIFPTDIGGVLIDLTAKGWEYSVEFGPRGEVEMYGIQADGPSEMDPTEFQGVDLLIGEFEARVGVNG